MWEVNDLLFHWCETKTDMNENFPAPNSSMLLFSGWNTLTNIFSWLHMSVYTWGGGSG